MDSVSLGGGAVPTLISSWLRGSGTSKGIQERCLNLYHYMTSNPALTPLQDPDNGLIGPEAVTSATTMNSGWAPPPLSESSGFLLPCSRNRTPKLNIFRLLASNHECSAYTGECHRELVQKVLPASLGRLAQSLVLNNKICLLSKNCKKTEWCIDIKCKASVFLRFNFF